MEEFVGDGANFQQNKNFPKIFPFINPINPFINVLNEIQII